MGQMSPEQQSKWVAKAKNYEIIGCYAQTELGHGSNVRGLETTATFIPETDEFDVHTPSLRATKFWPGCMGRTANFAVVYARLMLPENGTVKDYGVHPFLVQLRSLVDHKVRLGEGEEARYSLWVIVGQGRYYWRHWAKVWLEWQRQRVAAHGPRPHPARPDAHALLKGAHLDLHRGTLFLDASCRHIPLLLWSRILFLL